MASLRAPVMGIMGNVDTGKTTLMHAVCDVHRPKAEAGDITQRSSTTWLSIEDLLKRIQGLRAAQRFVPEIPGLMVIDTPGHAPFEGARTQAALQSDITVLVVDILGSVDAPTLEIVTMLRRHRLPFVVAVNKIDRLNGWISTDDVQGGVRRVLASQPERTRELYQAEMDRIKLEFATAGFNTSEYWSNPDPRTYISLVPLSAKSTLGVSNLLLCVLTLMQTVGRRRIDTTGIEFRCGVLDTAVLPGHGTAIQVLLTVGALRQNDRCVVACLSGSVAFNVRELVVNNKRTPLIEAPALVYVIAPETARALAGGPLLLTTPETESEILDSIQPISGVLSVKDKPNGVAVWARSAAVLESAVSSARAQGVNVSEFGMGTMSLLDARTAMMRLRGNCSAVLLFDTTVDVKARAELERNGVVILQDNVLHVLIANYLDYRKKRLAEFRDKHAKEMIWPVRLTMLPDHVYRNKPLVVGVRVERGRLCLGTPLVAMAKQKTPDLSSPNPKKVNDTRPTPLPEMMEPKMVEVGVVTSIQKDGKDVTEANPHEEVCVCIALGDNTFGRQFSVSDPLLSALSRESIDLAKKYWRDELTHEHWQLVREIKTELKISDPRQ